MIAWQQMRQQRVTQRAAIDRPREKLVRKGAPSLSDFELLEAIIGNGNGASDVSYIARQVQKLLNDGLDAVTLEKLTGVKGISTATATKLLAAIELSKRHLLRDDTPLKSQHDLLTRLSDIRSKQQEHFVCLSLDGGQRLLAQRVITIGTLDAVLAHPREIFSDPIVDRAASIVVAHNHPSGSAEPSDKDISLTQQLAAAGQMLGIPLRDHLIVSKQAHFSFRQHHLL